MRSEAGNEKQDAAGEGARFGGYVTTRILGAGGMGTVYEARHPTLGKRVALKVMKGSLAGDQIARERFLREAQAIALIAHPHVVDVFDLGIEGEHPFIVMELLEGETLDARLARKGRLGVARTVDLFLPVISAAAAIHEIGVVHRDLKPGNVMLARRGRVAVEPVILDFGISRSPEAAPGQKPLTEPHLLFGTPSYLSPEQLRDARAGGPQSDQYAVGVMLYECVTGRKPFAGGDRYELMHAAMTAEVVAPSALVPEIPPDLDRVILRSLSRSPEARHPSMRAFGSALLSFADHATWKRWAGEFAGGGGQADTTAETAAEIQRPTAPPRARKRQLWPWTGVGAGALVIGALVLAARAPSAPGPSPIPAAVPGALSRSASVLPAPGAVPPPVHAPAPVVVAPAAPAPVVPVVAPAKKRPSRPAANAKQASAPPIPHKPDGELRGTSATGKPASKARADDAIDPFAPVR